MALINNQLNLSAASSKDIPIGDIRISVSNDPGSDWVLCNGATIEKNTYPKLYSAYPPSLSYEWTKCGSYSASGAQLAYNNGTYVIGGTSGSGQMYHYVYTSTDLSQWTTRALASSDRNITFGGLAFNEGYWGYLGMWRTYGSSDPNTFYVDFFYTNNPANGWSTKRLATGVTSATAIFLVSGGGYFVCQYAYNAEWAGANIFRTQCSTTGASWSNTNCPISGTWYYVNNLWFVVNGTQIAYSSTPNGTWEQISIPISATSIQYGNGYYYIYGNNQIAYSSSLSGEWTILDVSITSGKMLYENDTLSIYNGTNGILTKDITKNIWISFTTPCSPSTIYYDGENWLTHSNTEIYYIDDTKLKLPNIDLGSPSKAYIRCDDNESYV